MDDMSADLEDYRRVVFFRDRETGQRGITVLHDTRLGPALGVCRSRPYDDEERAMADALRQAVGATRKAVVAGLPCGGGCTVLMNMPKPGRAVSPMPALGRMVEDLGGAYVLIPDSGHGTEDMDQVAEQTAHVLGHGREVRGDPSMATAVGVLRGIKAAVRHRLARDGLSGVRVAVMGLGPAGRRLAGLLRQEGARLTVADRDPRKTEQVVRELGVTCVATEEIVHLDTDVLAPCASKDVINDDTIVHLRCKIVAGTADDPLAAEHCGVGLHERGILYAPDYVISAGGLISLTAGLAPVGAGWPSVDARINAIADRLSALFDRAARENRATSEVALQMVERLVDQAISKIEPEALATAC